MEAPNTVSGLLRKRAELLKLREGLERDLRAVTCDLDHLDAAIALFDPTATPRALQRYATKHRAKKGTVRRFVFDHLRTAPGPVTSRQITEAWVRARGLKADYATFVLIRKRIGACLTSLQSEGLITGSGDIDGYKGWTVAGA